MRSSPERSLRATPTPFPLHAFKPGHRAIPRAERVSEAASEGR